jgi:hypothetical protein
MQSNASINTPTETYRKLAIERAHGLTPEIFFQTYLVGHGKPVIITDALNSWAAPLLWSFELFKTRYGSDNVAPCISPGFKCLKLMKFGDYIDYLDAPENPSPGLWVDAATLHPCQPPAEALPTPLYLAWNVFGQHPELLEDVELSPRFVEDLLPLLPEALRNTLDAATRYFAAGLMIGPKNAQIGLHYDFLDTHAYLAQVIGRKSCALFSPEDSDALYDGKVDVDAPDFEKFPLFRHATAYECTLEPGELLFIPHRWWHHVVSLEKTITVNYNFFNRVNLGAYLKHLLQDLPSVVEGLARSPDARKALGIKWESRGFDFPKSGQGLRSADLPGEKTERMKPSLSARSVVVAAKDHVSCDVGGEAAILNAKNGVYYALDPVGAHIWKLIQTPRRVADLRDSVLREYDVDSTRCECDLLLLLESLFAEGLIELQDRSAP